MAPLNRSTQKNRPAKSQRATTLEMVRHACPDTVQAQRISESFGLALIDSDGIRDLHRGQLIESADALKEGLAEKAMQIHMQRIVGSFVGSAYGAGQFYSRAVTEARDLTTKLSNDTRDEDLDGPVGFDSRAQRKREFAADMGLQPTCFAWQLKVPYRLTKTSPATPGSPTSARSNSPPTPSIKKPQRPRWQRSNSRNAGLRPRFSPASCVVATNWFGKRKKGRRKTAAHKV